ncbi:16S rRNA (cytidine(1402)-2'-O)-methyltransferase [soil metagenome]
MLGKLFLVATPIGNLQDITLRAIETLRAVDIIACEDTRHTGKLLKAFDISNKLISYHAHNEPERADQLASLLSEGKAVALVSDAGTPSINDPGYRIVLKAIEHGAEVIAIPGASAFISAAIISGLPTDSIFFGGFLPSKKGERRKRLSDLKVIPATLVFYESPHRIGPSLLDCLDILGDRQAALARELTKLHEEIVRGSLSHLAARFTSERTKGEIVLCIDRGHGESRKSLPTGSLADRVADLEASGLDRKAALKTAARELGIPKSEAYRRLVGEK